MTMKRCSKFLAWLLTLIMVFSMMPVVVFADEGEATTQGPSLVVPGDELGIAGKQGALVVHLDQRKNNIFVAMTATKHSTNGRLVAKKVSVTDGKILFREESEAEAISIWTITCENGAYYLQSGGQYLDLSSGAKMTSKP